MYELLFKKSLHSRLFYEMCYKQCGWVILHSVTSRCWRCLTVNVSQIQTPPQSDLTDTLTLFLATNGQCVKPHFGRDKHVPRHMSWGPDVKGTPLFHHSDKCNAVASSPLILWEIVQIKEQKLSYEKKDVDKMRVRKFRGELLQEAARLFVFIGRCSVFTARLDPNRGHRAFID